MCVCIYALYVYVCVCVRVSLKDLTARLILQLVLQLDVICAFFALNYSLTTEIETSWLEITGSDNKSRMVSLFSFSLFLVKREPKVYFSQSNCVLESTG